MRFCVSGNSTASQSPNPHASSLAAQRLSEMCLRMRTWRRKSPMPVPPGGKPRASSSPQRGFSCYKACRDSLTNMAFALNDCERKKITMDKRLLAQQLRQRQYAHGHLPRYLIDGVSDEEMIDCYITCSCCGEKQVTPQQLEVAIAQARDAYHFLMLCDEQARAGSRGHIQLPPPGPNRSARRAHKRRR